MDAKLKHLEFIQAIIARHSNNLFILKGWSVTLVAALFALSTKNSTPAYFLIAFMSVLIFWGLEGRFLSRERMFRDLYDHVRELPPEKVDFSMDVEIYKTKSRNSWVACIRAGTLLWFYLPLLVTMIIVMVLIMHS